MPLLGSQAGAIISRVLNACPPGVSPEDLSSEACILVLDVVHSFDESRGTLTGYISHVLTRRLPRIAKSLRGDIQLGDGIDIPTEYSHEVEQTDEAELIEEIMKAVLSRTNIELVRRRISGQSYRTIADNISVATGRKFSVNTVRKIIATSIEEVQRELIARGLDVSVSVTRRLI